MVILSFISVCLEWADRIMKGPEMAYTKAAVTLGSYSWYWWNYTIHFLGLYSYLWYIAP